MVLERRSACGCDVTAIKSRGFGDCAVLVPVPVPAYYADGLQLNAPIHRHVSAVLFFLAQHKASTRLNVTSADSQPISILGTSFPDRAPSHGPDSPLRAARKQARS